MAELHGGTVTFLFTDIEGSTRLLKTLGGGYGEVLGEHQRILRAVFAAHGGQEVDSQGDSFFVAFRTAKDALAAAVDAQRDLEAQAWPEGAQVRVRMGLHTGEPKVGGERYVGIGVHRAARIGAAGHGGQVLLSTTTKELAEEDLPPGVAIRDLGERRLKDLDQRQRLYQLVIDGLASEFRPLRTLDVELKRKRRRLYAGSALIGAAAAAVAIPIFALGTGGSNVKVVPNSVAVIDPKTNDVVDDVAVGARPAEIVAGSGAIWVANLDDESVSRIDLKTRRQVRAISIGVEPMGLAAGGGGVWFASPGRNVSSHGDPYTAIRLGRIDPAFDSAAPFTELRNLASPFGGFGALTAGRRSVWVTSGDGVIRFDPATRRETKAGAPTGGGSTLSGLAVGTGTIWLSDGGRNRVLKLDPTGVLLESIKVGNEPSAIALGEGAVWVADTADDEVKRIDPATNSVETTITVGDSPTGIAVGAGAVWVANSGSGTVSRIDPGTNDVKTIELGGSPAALGLGRSRVGERSTGRDERRQRPGRRPLGRDRATRPERRRHHRSGPQHNRSRVAGRSGDVREARRVSRPAAAGRRAPRPGRCAVSAEAFRGPPHLHVHHQAGLPLLTTLERARHRRNLQVLDRADPQPATHRTGARHPR
jgi:YVTN family beta-propeller protein